MYDGAQPGLVGWGLSPVASVHSWVVASCDVSCQKQSSRAAVTALGEECERYQMSCMAADLDLNVFTHSGFYGLLLSIGIQNLWGKAVNVRDYLGFYLLLQTRSNTLLLPFTLHLENLKAHTVIYMILKILQISLSLNPKQWLHSTSTLCEQCSDWTSTLCADKTPNNPLHRGSSSCHFTAHRPEFGNKTWDKSRGYS